MKRDEGMKSEMKRLKKKNWSENMSSQIWCYLKFPLWDEEMKSETMKCFSDEEMKSEVKSYMKR